MKCEHGIEVRVEIELYDDSSWCDGIVLHEKNGGPAGDFLKVSGCELCGLIEIEWEDKKRGKKSGR